MYNLKPRSSSDVYLPFNIQYVLSFHVYMAYEMLNATNTACRRMPHVCSFVTKSKMLFFSFLVKNKKKESLSMMTVPVSQRGAASDSLALLLQRRVCTFLIKVLLLVTSWISVSPKLHKRVAHSTVSYTSSNVSHKITSKMLHHSSGHSTGNSNHKQVEIGQQQHACVQHLHFNQARPTECHILLAWTPIQWRKKIVCILWTQSMWENLWNNKHMSDSLLWYRFHCTYSDTQVSLHLPQYTGLTALTLIHMFHCTYSNT